MKCNKQRKAASGSGRAVVGGGVKGLRIWVCWVIYPTVFSSRIPFDWWNFFLLHIYTPYLFILFDTYTDLFSFSSFCVCFFFSCEGGGAGKVGRASRQCHFRYRRPSCRPRVRWGLNPIKTSIFFSGGGTSHFFLPFPPRAKPLTRNEPGRCIRECGGGNTDFLHSLPRRGGLRVLSVKALLFITLFWLISG